MLLTETDLISAKQYLFAKDRQHDLYSLVYVAPDDLLGPVYPLAQLSIQGFRTPLMDNYYFFQYNKENSNGYKSNLIDWDSPNTTIADTLSTNDDWYADEQIVDLYFNNLLTRRLFGD